MITTQKNGSIKDQLMKVLANSSLTRILIFQKSLFPQWLSQKLLMTTNLFNITSNHLQVSNTILLRRQFKPEVNLKEVVILRLHLSYQSTIDRICWTKSTCFKLHSKLRKAFLITINIHLKMTMFNKKNTDSKTLPLTTQ